ncbi:methyltransferase domain-containing protein [Diaporthe amygdali]|uniref:methyltransferase domain-containing protein n=1 Tax=Phomopsis amygdali TaxID=1214568 RepID=UPI0022FF1285|nr:methyltransferase domain-containing protein [Diaporthe amygdali]KAJ0122568.1 methyltransferase domain-containing protein [Diaporthe amygdali]
MSVTTNTANNPHLTRSYVLKNVNEAQEVYDAWAKTYDSDLRDPSQNYVGPAAVARLVAGALGTPTISPDLLLLDAGCGTGLAGVELARLGAKHIDGRDLSPGMLAVARQSGAYEALQTTDLNKPLDVQDGKYDVVVCVGTFTHTHVGPEALRELVRVTKREGVVVATVLDDIWESQGFKAEVARLEADGKAKVLSAESGDYRKGCGVTATFVVLRVLV